MPCVNKSEPVPASVRLTIEARLHDLGMRIAETPAKKQDQQKK
jgi:hypothetical protein